MVNSLNIARLLTGCNIGAGVKKSAQEAFKWYRKAAEQGNAMGEYLAAMCYYEGRGVTQKYSEAFKFFRRSAEDNISQAQFMVGKCYYYGHGTKLDKKEAVKWFRKSAAQNNDDAQHALGVCYKNGEGVTKNKVFASGQAIREASLTVLRPTIHGSETSRTQKRSLCGLAASSGVLNPRDE